MSLAERLRAIREAMGLTQEAVSRTSGGCAESVEDENGRSDIQIST